MGSGNIPLKQDVYIVAVTANRINKEWMDLKNQGHSAVLNISQYVACPAEMRNS